MKKLSNSINDINKSKYGILGLDVGSFGRWIRLFVGILYLIPITLSILFDPETLSILTETIKISTNVISFYITMIIYFVIIIFLYIFVYKVFGNLVFAKNNVWINTLIFVGPILVVGYWNILTGPFSNIKVPLPLVSASTIYIAMSLILEWKLKYGGCEVVSLPIILFKKRYKTYCIPIVAVDVIEKTLVDKSFKK